MLSLACGPHFETLWLKRHADLYAFSQSQLRWLILLTSVSWICRWFSWLIIKTEKKEETVSLALSKGHKSYQLINKHVVSCLFNRYKNPNLCREQRLQEVANPVSMLNCGISIYICKSKPRKGKYFSKRWTCYSNVKREVSVSGVKPFYVFISKWIWRGAKNRKTLKELINLHTFQMLQKCASSKKVYVMAVKELKYGKTSVWWFEVVDLYETSDKSSCFYEPRPSVQMKCLSTWLFSALNWNWYFQILQSTATLSHASYHKWSPRSSLWNPRLESAQVGEGGCCPWERSACSLFLIVKFRKRFGCVYSGVW